MITEDLLAYMCVLAVEDVWNSLGDDERGVGGHNTTGCLVRLEDELERRIIPRDSETGETVDQDSENLLGLVKKREKINGVKPYGDPDLVAANVECAEACHRFYYLEIAKRLSEEIEERRNRLSFDPPFGATDDSWSECRQNWLNSLSECDEWIRRVRNRIRDKERISSEYDGLVIQNCRNIIRDVDRH